jgi:uncharacterized phiE125 gp8 family phage protein
MTTVKTAYLHQQNEYSPAWNYELVSLVTPAEIPLSLTTLKQWLRLDVSDTSEDTILQLLVDQAVSCFEAVSRTILMNTNFKTFRDVFSQWYELRKSKLVSITSVKYNDEDENQQTISSSDYYFNADPFYSSLVFDKDYSFPTISSRPSSIEIAFVAGLSATTALVPADIQVALLNHVAFLYENRGDCACDDFSSVPAVSMNTYRKYQIVEIGA